MSASRTSAIDYERCVAYYRAGRRIEGATEAAEVQGLMPVSLS